jgi:hypothetical protein
MTSSIIIPSLTPFDQRLVAGLQQSQSDLNVVTGRSLRHRLSQGWNAGTFSATDATPGTQFACIPIPTDAYAVRLVFANNLATPYSVTSASVSYGSAVNDYVNPPGGGTWTPITFQHGGADVDDIVLGGTTRNLTVAAAGAADPNTGSAFVPNYAYSDFVPVYPVAPASGGVRFLFIRTYSPAQTRTRGYGTGQDVSQHAVVWAGNPAINNGFDSNTAAIGNADFATTPGVVGSFSIGIGTPLFVAIEYLSATPSVQLYTLGDSQMEGATTVSGLSNFVRLAQVKISTPTLPVELKGGAWGGQPSDTWWPMGVKSLSTITPSIAVLQAISGNDTGTIPGYMRGLGRSISFANKVRQAGGIAILCTPFPRPSWDPTMWAQCRAEVLKLQGTQSGLIIFDTCVGIGSMTNGVYDRNYLPGMSNDNLHPNDAAHAILAANFTPLLKQLLKL